MIKVLFAVLSGLTAFFLVLPFLNVLFSRFCREKLTEPVKTPFDYGIIITAYRNAAIAQPLIQSLLLQRYKNYHIYFVADACEVSDWDLEDQRLTVLNPQPALNLKAKSIIHGMEHYIRPHDYTVVFDADNLAHPDFLEIINNYANQGFLAIQGQRTAKNLDTTMACADATGEFYKNYIDRYAPYLIGSSAVISGSGMAVRTDVYDAYLKSPEIEQGKHLWKKMLQEDKILQNNLLDQDIRIAYAWDAVVYDEKVTTEDAVETQRSRWLFSYFQNIPNSSRILMKGLTRLGWNQWLFGLVTIAPPMFLQLFAGVALAALGLLIWPAWTIVLAVSLLLFAGTVLWTLRLSDAPPAIWSTLWSMPTFVWRQIKGLLRMGNPNKNFKHTEHTRRVSIEEILHQKNS